MAAAWLCAAGQFGCPPHGSSAFPTVSALPEADRRPDAIAVDLPSAPPPAEHRAEAADGIVTLQTPLGMDAARGTVEEFFRAVVRQDVGALAATLAAGAQVEDTHRGAPLGAAPAKTREARSWWSQRFRKHAYDELAARLVYRESDIETYRPDQLDELPAEVRRGEGAGRPPVAATDVILRVPIVTHTLRSERLFGDHLYFWLRPEGDRYVIYHLAEPFPF